MWLKKSVLIVVSLGIFVALDLFVSDSINPYILQIIVYSGINIMLAVSLNLINGFTGQFSIGHAGFMAIGAYTSAAITFYLGPGILNSAFLPPLILKWLFFIVALTLGGLAAALAGLLVGIPSLRLKGDYLAIVTLGFGEIIRVVILNVNAVGGARGFADIPEYTSLFWVLAFALLTIVVIRNIMWSSHGKAFLSVREDEVAAEAMGINSTYYKVIAFVIGAFFAGVAGGLLAHYLLYLHTNSFTFMKSIEIIVMVVLGGMGSLSGSIVAAIVLTLLPEVLRPVKEYRLVIYSALLIVMMLTRPTGLFGTKELTISRLKRFLVRNPTPAG
jgi:branched-chain amino acid transport system permease protein